MINRVILVGRLTADPMLRYTPSGHAVCSFTLACNRPFSNQQGEKEADFISIVVWKKQAENAANYLKKGSLVGIDGRLQTRSYDNNEGKRVFITEVVADSVQFLEPKGNKTSNQPNTQQAGRGEPKTSFDNDPFANDGQPIDISDDDLPF